MANQELILTAAQIRRLYDAVDGSDAGQKVKVYETNLSNGYVRTVAVSYTDTPGGDDGIQILVDGSGQTTEL